MPTKGIQFYVYISNPNISVNISIGSEYSQTFNFIPNSTSNIVASFVIQPSSFEIGSTTYGIMAENFCCNVNQTINSSSSNIFSLNQSVSPLTGGIGESSSDDLWNFMNTSSQIVSGNGSHFAISYGFYNAGPGVMGLTNQHQFYIYVTDVYTNWMTDLNSKNSNFGDCKFSSFVLPGAHDSGMCNGSFFSDLNTSTQLFQSICQNYGLPYNDAIFSSSIAFQTIVNMSFTQKDSITMLLNLGIRFFDFRPGFNCVSTDNTFSGIYHQHMIVPGYLFEQFLTDVITWLTTPENSGEIVVVYLNYNGFPSSISSMQPINFFENNFIGELVGLIGSKNGIPNLVYGGPSSLTSTYSSLIGSNTRLIFLNNLSNTPIPNLPNATLLDSYTDEAYEVTEVEPIINQLTNTLTEAKTAQDNFTLLQLQGTITAATNYIVGALNSISTSAASSPLLSTKPAFDCQTYAFLQSQVANNQALASGMLYVCLNDFADNALVSNCINMTAINTATYR